MRIPSENAKALLLIGVVFAVAVPSAIVGRQAAPGVRRTDLQRHNLSIHGREMIQARVEIDPGATAPLHWHPGEEVVYVIEGALDYRLDGRAPVTVKAGEVLFIPSRVPHSATNTGATLGAELATYIVDKGKPLLNPGRP